MKNSLARRLPIRLGTRASALALAQANEAARTITSAFGLMPEAVLVVPMTTSGDRHLEGTLSEVGGKGLFTKEIEEALLADRVDLAVHSMKDVATLLPAGLVIPCLFPRADVRDVILSNHPGGLEGLPEGAVFGTASLRRAAQLLHMRPDLQVIPFRGNVQTRLKKLSDRMVDATMLAVAGLQRLGMWRAEAYDALSPHFFVPAVAQGAIGLQCRSEDAQMLELLATISHEPTSLAVSAERAMLRVLDGSCRTPIGGYATLEEDGTMMRLTGVIISPDGVTLHRHEATAQPEHAASLGEAVGHHLRRLAGDHFFNTVQALT